MRFLIRLRDRLNDPATSYLPFRVTSLSLSLLYVDNFVARSSTRSICTCTMVHRDFRPTALWPSRLGRNAKVHLYIVEARVDSVFLIIR